MSNGDFVIVNEDHQEEFDKFKDKVFTILAVSSTSAPRVIKATDLINIWMQLRKTSLQSVHFLGEMYYFIPPAQMDHLCQWIYDARDHCYI